METKKIFNKLVRDNIPDIIKQNGDIPEVEILSDFLYLKKLDEKLLEECNEVVLSDNKISKIEELADLLEVIYAIANTLDITIDYIEKVREAKAEKRGSFKKSFY